MDMTLSSGKAQTQRSGLLWRFLPLIGILALAFAVRVVFMNDAVYKGDVEHLASWVETIRVNGLLKFYDHTFRLGVWDRVYPPVQMVVLKLIAMAYGQRPVTNAVVNDPTFLWMLKLFPLLCDLTLIAAVYLWLEDRPRLKWIVPGLLAIFPGVLITTAWWGQFDSPYTLFLALTLIALNRDKPLLAWGLFAIAVLLKQPAIVLGPIPLVLTFRRYGWQMTLKAGALCGLIIAVAFAPFVVVNGKDALSPYLNAGDAFPYFTNNAYNLWYAVATIQKGSEIHFQEAAFKDSKTAFSLISYKNAGFIMFGALVLLIMVLMWRYYDRRYEFVWAALLYFGFFMLPTQVHERYLYAGAVLSVIAVAQDRRLWWIVLGVMVSFSANILLVLIPFFAPAQNQQLVRFTLPTALANSVLFVGLMYVSMTAKREVAMIAGQPSP